MFSYFLNFISKIEYSEFKISKGLLSESERYNAIEIWTYNFGSCSPVPELTPACMYVCVCVCVCK